jgi:hypothetical protein
VQAEAFAPQVCYLAGQSPKAPSVFGHFVIPKMLCTLQKLEQMQAEAKEKAKQQLEEEELEKEQQEQMGQQGANVISESVSFE